MVHGMYQYTDEYGNKQYLSARIGGFKDVQTAVRAIAKRGGVGIVTDHRNIPLHVVRNGQLRKVTI